MDLSFNLIIYSLYLTIVYAIAERLRRKRIEKDLSLNPLKRATVHNEFFIKFSKSSLNERYMGAIVFFIIAAIVGIWMLSAPGIKLSNFEFIVFFIFEVSGFTSIGMALLLSTYWGPIYIINSNCIERIYPEFRKSRIFWHDISEVYQNFSDTRMIVKADDDKMVFPVDYEGVTHFLALVAIYLPENKWKKIQDKVTRAYNRIDWSYCDNGERVNLPRPR